MRIVIIGAGFAGMYAALSAARLRDIKGVSPEELEIALVAPEPTLVIRPRLYEPKPETLTAPFAGCPQGRRRRLYQRQRRDDRHRIPHRCRSRPPTISDSRSPTIGWSWRPEAGCSVRIFPASPSMASASTISTMRSRSTSICMAWSNRPASNGRDTVVVAGGGFTGIEAATEIPARLRDDPRQGRQDRASSLSNATVRSRPTWAKVRAPSSRRRCASSVWRPGSVPALPRWMQSGDHAVRAANTSKPRP